MVQARNRDDTPAPVWAGREKQAAKGRVRRRNGMGKPVRRTRRAPLAQSAEQRPFKSWVAGSNPAGGTTAGGAEHPSQRERPFLPSASERADDPMAWKPRPAVPVKVSTEGMPRHSGMPARLRKRVTAASTPPRPRHARTVRKDSHGRAGQGNDAGSRPAILSDRQRPSSAATPSRLRSSDGSERSISNRPAAGPNPAEGTDAGHHGRRQAHNQRIRWHRRLDHARRTAGKQADVVKRHHTCFPSMDRGFDPRHPHAGSQHVPSMRRAPRTLDSRGEAAELNPMFRHQPARKTKTMVAHPPGLRMSRAEDPSRSARRWTGRRRSPWMGSNPIPSTRRSTKADASRPSASRAWQPRGDAIP